MSDDDGAWVRPRGRAWGNEAQRAVLHAIAEDVARRTEHKVVAIEALRSDGFLEFVAIAGDEAARQKMLGQASPLALDHILSLGLDLEGWKHIPHERLDETTRTFLDQYGHRPDVPASDLPDGWDPDDQLVRLLENDEGELRGMIYLDEPLSGLRPTAETVAAINAEAGVMLEAVVSIVERELYGEQVRMVTQARRAIESVRPGLGEEEFLAAVSRAMVEGMAVDTVDVISEATDVPELEDERRHVSEMMRRQWERRGHLVVERELTWGAGEDAIATPPSLSRILDAHGLGSGLLVPIGAGEEYLGTLAMGRGVDEPRWIASEIVAATTVAGDLARLVLESRLMERERALNAELRGVADYRRDMVFTLAHELRNPVSVLWTHLELLADEDDPGLREESVHAMDRAARRIEDMIEDLMALATADDPERSTPRTRVDLSALVQEICQFQATTAALSGVELEVAVVDGLRIVGEVAGLQRLVTNLLSNALKYTLSGGTVRVALAPERLDGRDGVLLTCSDTGVGIAPDDLESVFKPFYRSARPEARRRPGTGLGLAITERVVTGHHGRVGVESVLGAGSTFRVWLPLAPPDAP